MDGDTLCTFVAEQMVNIIQSMAFHLGNDAGAVHSASVARVTCNNPPPLLNNPDWFEFMFMNSELDGDFF